MSKARQVGGLILAAALFGCGTETPAGEMGGDASSADATALGDTASTDAAPEVAAPPAVYCPKASPCHKGQCCTCGPGDDCEAGIDNALSALAELINGNIKDAIKTGTLSLGAELAGGQPEPSKPFALNMYQTSLDPANAKCNAAKERCKWLVDAGSYVDDCSVLVSFPDAVVYGNDLTAGGPNGAFELNVPVLGIVLKLQVVRARIEGKVARDVDGDIYRIEGILGGAIPRVLLEQALDDLPAEGLPISKAALKDLIQSLVNDDTDALGADGQPGTDGVRESASVALKFVGIPAELGEVTFATYTQGKTAPGWLMDACTSDADCEPGAGRCLPGEEGGGTVCLETCEGACRGGYECKLGADPTDPQAICFPTYCQHPPDEFSKVAFHISELSLGASATAGEGIDVDGACSAPVAEPGDGEACAPAGR